MTTYLKFIVLFLAFSLSIISCSKDEIENFETDGILDPIPVFQNHGEDPIFNIYEFNLKNSDKVTKTLVFSYLDVPDKAITRGPVIAIANNGNILAAVQKLEKNEDKGEMDILLAVSQDGGKTFKKKIIFPSDEKNGRKMNPCFVIDRLGINGPKGRIYCFTLSFKDTSRLSWETKKGESNTIFRYSDDNGLTWSQEFDLYDRIPNAYTVFGPSPSSGIQLNNGTLIIPGFVVKSDVTLRSGIIFKTPNGNWEFSAPNFSQSPGENECTIAPGLDKQTIILNCRTEYAKERRIYQIKNILDKSTGSEIKWFVDPTNGGFKVSGSCQGCLILIDNPQKPFYLFSHPLDSNPRNKICIWYSTDLQNWKKFYYLTESPSAGYSNLAYYNNKLFAIYESDNFHTACQIQDLTPLLSQFEP